jgi:Tlde1 domain
VGRRRAGEHGVINDDGGLLIRVGKGPIAAGVAAFAVGFTSYLWLATGPAPANAGSRADARIHSAFNSFDTKVPGRAAATVGSDIRDGFGARWASFEAADATEFAFNERFALNETDSQADPGSPRPSFGERFALNESDATGSLQRAASFGDRFGGESTASGATARSTAARPDATAQRVATAMATPRADPRSVVAKSAPKRPKEPRYQLASASATSLPLAYAPTDPVKAAKPLGDVVTSRTAIYDITARTVYMPNGRRLEAHSGLGNRMDDPQHVTAKNAGPTPPNVYDLKLRESLFHGVRAVRLIPTDGSKMYGRDGILAHSYMLGPSGQSNGCVSISNYGAFLDAFMRGEVDRLVVVERLGDPPPARTASEWLKDLFRS